MAACCGFLLNAPVWRIVPLALARSLRKIPFVRHVGGAFTRAPHELSGSLGEEASSLVENAFRDVDPARLVDYHTHVVGLGAGGTGTFVNPHMTSWWHPIKRLQFAIYASAAGIENIADADREYMERLSAQVRNIEGHGRYHLLAFDKHYRKDGTVDLEKTEFYVPNEYALGLAADYPELFLPAMSVHPYRPDALEELERWASRGCRLLKWLPNAMGIDPSDPKCDPFYERLREFGVVLLSHGGEEKAVDAEEDQKLGNPLLLRRALDHGVKVIVAHCAGLGTNEDLDDPARRRLTNFDLFLKLVDSGRYEGRLFADISAMTQRNRIGRPLTTVLDRADLQGCLVNGSDYPLPAINVLVSTKALVRAGYLTAAERRHLNEIYDYNPLLYDFVLKRTITSPATGRRLAASIFMAHPGLGE
jgi:uncharacterized protein